MADLEVLALDTTVPQIRAPGAGDGYSVPRNMTMASGTTFLSPQIMLSGNISSAAWTTSGIGLAAVARTITDTSSSGTVAAAYTNVLGGNTIAASNSTTFTDYASLFLNTPSAGTNVTITNSFSLVTAGAVKFGGNLTLNAGTANGIGYLNANKIVTTGSALTFDGTNFATTGTASATKLIPTGGTVSGNGMYLPASNSIGISTGGADAIRVNSSQQTGFGNTSPAFRVHITQTSSGAATTVACLENAASATSTEARLLFVQGGNTTRGGYVGGINEDSSGSPTSLVFGTSAAFATPTERMRITSAGNVVVNTAALGTTATNGFLYIPTCAGAPTGVPTTFTGRSPLIVDSTNNRFYVYVSGSWKYASLT